ncbi:guanylate-binding protein 2-like [Ruditapes philippinarum]|uniref:guanylate-binding protein 2-like n=1 Tax=Ruditapes philippinarum TaxID=129788 RepID=UPI00295AD111|nr:guanylate-binding protein 2-like [Ruditapes philippinarum]
MKIITPVFILCLRDFYLQLTDKDGKEITPDKYFENCLSMSDGESKEKIDETRDCIKKYFPRRKCFTLTHPATGKKLAKIEGFGDDQLNVDFVRECISLQEYVYSCEHKVTDGVSKAPVKGYDFESFTRTYVEALQTGSVLSYEKAYEKVSKRHNNKLVATLVHEFETELKKMDTPVKRKTDIERKTFEILNKKLKQLRNESYPYKNNIHEVLAMEKMKAIADKFRDQNSLLVQHNLQKTLKTLYDDLIEQNEVLIDSKEGAMFYNLMISDRMKSLFHSKMQPYDEDEVYQNFFPSADDHINFIYIFQKTSFL